MCTAQGCQTGRPNARPGARRSAPERIAGAARGGRYDARNALDIHDVVNDVLSNFQSALKH